MLYLSSNAFVGSVNIPLAPRESATIGVKFPADYFNLTEEYKNIQPPIVQTENAVSRNMQNLPEMKDFFTTDPFQQHMLEVLLSVLIVFIVILLFSGVLSRMKYIGNSLLIGLVILCVFVF
jgi:hypothetical protein